MSVHCKECNAEVEVIEVEVRGWEKRVSFSYGTVPIYPVGDEVELDPGDFEVDDSESGDYLDDDLWEEVEVVRCPECQAEHATHNADALFEVRGEGEAEPSGDRFIIVHGTCWDEKEDEPYTYESSNDLAMLMEVPNFTVGMCFIWDCEDERVAASGVHVKPELIERYRGWLARQEAKPEENESLRCDLDYRGETPEGSFFVFTGEEREVRKGEYFVGRSSTPRIMRQGDAENHYGGGPRMIVRLVVPDEEDVEQRKAEEVADLIAGIEAERYELRGAFDDEHVTYSRFSTAEQAIEFGEANSFVYHIVDSKMAVIVASSPEEEQSEGSRERLEDLLLRAR